MPGWLYIIPPLSSSSAGLSSDHLLLTELTVGIMPPPLYGLLRQQAATQAA